jgi:CheY-like chemotaxis protein
MLVGAERSPERRAKHARVELQRFLRHMTRRWTGESRAVGADFAIVTEGIVPERLLVDLVALSRSLGNLVSNALRHAPRGGVRLALSGSKTDGLVIRVLDRGPGLPATLLDGEARGGPVVLRRDGHGLGIHIVRRLAEEMGADLVFRNRDGGGALVELRFAPALCDWSGAEPQQQGKAALDGLRILLAEDNPTNQMVATQMLRALRAEVTVAADGVEALERFEEREFDLVIVDIEMPRMTGLDVIRAIRSRRDGRAQVPIVALTAYAMREHRERIAAAGANGLISKPIISIQALGESLRGHLDAARPAAPANPIAAAVDETDINLATFDALCAAIGPDMMEELLEKVVADLLQARADLEAAADPIDRGPIRSASHILISVAGAVGATGLQSSARTLNVAAHDPAEAGLAEGVARCVTQIDAVVAFLRKRSQAR